MHRMFILISFQILSGKHPWSGIRNDIAVMFQLARGNKPKRPLSRPIEDQHWELIERCWSSVDDRPCAKDVVSSLQQYLHSFPPPLPLFDVFRLLSHSSVAPPNSAPVVPTPNHPGEQNIGILELNVQSPDQPEAPLDYRSAILQDGK
jgi:hypothetical protein